MNKSWSSSRRTLPRWIVATARCVLLVSTWNLVTAPCLSQENADAELGNVYLLKEQWSVAAQGPVHLREKRGTTEYWIRVSNLNKDADGRPTLELGFELVRPAAFAEQTLRLQFSPGTNLETVTGLDQVASRADGLYDDFLRGSEQDLNTREFVCQGLIVEELRRTWADVFLVGASD